MQDHKVLLEHGFFEAMQNLKKMKESRLKSLSESTPNAPETISPGTGQTDIAQIARKIAYGKGIAGFTLPASIGFVQPLTGPTGFIFGAVPRGKTNVRGGTPAEDIVIIRKMMETDVREVTIDTTNEVITDMGTLFGENYADLVADFIARGGEIYPDQNGETLPYFFLSYALNRIIQKTNADFTNWLSTEATIKGTVTISTYDDISRIFGAIGELREALYKQTHKIGRVWILVSPRIAGFLSSTVGSTSSNGAEIFNTGRIIPSNINPNYVMTMGDVDVYQYDSDGTVTGGTSGTTENAGRIYVGYKGDANSSSIYYTPYKEYFVKGGDDYQTGQSSIFYRIRDAWATNPQDTYDKTIDEVDIENSTTGNPVGQNKSQYVVAADVTFGEALVV